MPMKPGLIKLTQDMFRGANGMAIRAVFQEYCNPGIIISDINLVRDPNSRACNLIVGYAKASEMRETKRGGPTAGGFGFDDRVHEGKRHEFKIPLSYESGYLETDMLIGKLSLIRD